MWTMLLCLACGGNRFGSGPLSVERTEPWSALALPEGRTVSSDPDGLTVRYDDGAVAQIDARWRASLSEAGFALVQDQSRGAMISCTFEREAERVALSVSEIRGTTTVSLVSLP